TFLSSSLRTQGPITTVGSWLRGRQPFRLNRESNAVWVPAFAGTTSHRFGVELRPPVQRAFLQQCIADIGSLFLFQPFAFPKRQAVGSMRGPGRLQGAAGVAALAQREPD